MFHFVHIYLTPQAQAQWERSMRQPDVNRTDTHTYVCAICETEAHLTSLLLPRLSKCIVPHYGAATNIPGPGLSVIRISSLN